MSKGRLRRPFERPAKTLISFQLRSTRVSISISVPILVTSWLLLSRLLAGLASGSRRRTEGRSHSFRVTNDIQKHINTPHLMVTYGDVHQRWTIDGSCVDVLLDIVLLPSVHCFQFNLHRLCLCYVYHKHRRWRLNCVNHRFTRNSVPAITVSISVPVHSLPLYANIS
jgi:hypothetical protein